MGNLSEHFNKEDFVCRCGKCQKEFKINLGLVGALENIWVHFNRPVKVVCAFRCENHPQTKGGKNDFHSQGKAADICIEGVSLKDLYAYLKNIPEIKGIGYRPRENYFHVDLRREEERTEFVREFSKDIPFTPDKKFSYGFE